MKAKYAVPLWLILLLYLGSFTGAFYGVNEIYRAYHPHDFVYTYDAQEGEGAYYINGEHYVPSEKQVSIITEKKECEEQGGDFYYEKDFKMELTDNGYVFKDALGCTKPSETIFEIEF
jgi:hypothetical protein